MSVTLAAIFSDNMVLQHGQKVPVWGWAKPGETVKVKFAGQQESAVTSKNGKWKVVLKPLEISLKPEELTVTVSKSKTSICLKNILVGDVWVCSGQSNMQYMLRNCNNPKQEIESANYPGIRLFMVPSVAKLNPDRDIKGSWENCNPNTIPTFSAVAYFFGREIHRKTGIPQGLINCSWGGTCAEAWTSRKYLESEPVFKKALKAYDLWLKTPENEVFNQMKQEQEEWQKKYDIKDGENLGEAKSWHMPELDISTWGKMTLPGPWRQQGADFNGVLWFRKEVNIPAEWAGKTLKLSLGPIDKSEITYFNGEEVGSLTMEQTPDAWCTPRVYPVPGKLVKAGRNVVAVRAFSNIYAAGFSGAPEQLKIFPEDQAISNSDPISLSGTWKYEVEANFGIVPGPPPPPLGDNNPNSPHILFDNMISPLLGYGIKGAIWYQGESNAPRSDEYAKLFQLMIKCWRKAWKQGNFPFYFVQLANYNQTNGAPDSWAELREAQLKTLELPNTAMAVTTDIGESDDIHPHNKQDVGYRLALPALANNYGFKKLVYSGPVYRSMNVKQNQVKIKFDHSAGGLIVHGKKLEGFTIAGKDRKFVPAEAVIDGDTVIVSSASISKPAAVRYAWADNPCGTLYNASDLPASPFRTDKWPLKLK
jgi:sialate O-acetylesterase